MTTEQKAKAYDEALERAKKWYNPTDADLYTCVAESIFPELKEPKNKRIREALIYHYQGDGCLCTNEYRIDYKDIRSWLEKQGTSYTKEELEKQGEHTDKVEPKIKVKYAGCEYNVLEVKDIVGVTYYGIEDEPNHIDYVKAENCEIISGYAIKEDGSSYPTKPVVFLEQKSQRMVSAEAKEALYDKPTDEEMKELLRTEYEKGRADAIAEMKSSWSEKDEKVIAIINNALTESNTPPDDYDKVYDWLESLRKRIGE